MTSDDLAEAITRLRAAGARAGEGLQAVDEAIARHAVALGKHGYPVGDSARLMQGAVATAGGAVSGAIHDELGQVEEQRQRHTGAGGPCLTRSSPTSAPSAKARRLRVPRVLGTEVHPLTEQFNAYGNDNTSAETWTGADSTYSVKLPDGRVLWIFSDTFLGTVDPDGSRVLADADGRTYDMMRNTFVVQDGTAMRTVLGPGQRPTSIVSPDMLGHPGEVFWAGGAQIHDGKVEIVYRRYQDFYAVGAAVATFDPADLSRPSDLVEVASTPGIAWGSAVQRVGGHTYVYGSQDTGGVKNLRIARVEGASLTGTWEYLTAERTWSPDESAAADHLAGVSNEFSVVPMGDRYVLVTHDTTEAFSGDVVGLVGPTPYGPFEDKTVLFTTPETGRYGSYGDPNIYTYNALAHPHVDRDPDRLVVSYNVHSAQTAGRGLRREDLSVHRDVSIYRPRFVTVQFDDVVLG